jgi:hypothetical protein
MFPLSLALDKHNYAWQNRIMIFTGKTPRGLEIAEDGLKKGLGSLGTDLILELGDINAGSETCSFVRVEGRRDFSTTPLDRTVPLQDLWAMVVAGLAEVEAELDVEDEMGGVVITGFGFRCDEGG